MRTVRLITSRLRETRLSSFTGGGRPIRPEVPTTATRSLDDPHMYSHIALLPTIPLAATHGVVELALLQSVVVGLSAAYHRSYERPGALAQIEGTAAKVLFIYGTMQTLTNFPPSMALFVAEAGCLGATVSTFAVTTLHKKDINMYDQWHPWGLHVVPGLWSILVATNHSALFF